VRQCCLRGLGSAPYTTGGAYVSDHQNPNRKETKGQNRRKRDGREESEGEGKKDRRRAGKWNGWMGKIVPLFLALMDLRNRGFT